MATHRPESKTLDVLLELKDAGLIAADENATQVDGTDAIIDLGEGRVKGELIINVTACEVDTGDEVYKIVPLFSNDAAHASGVVAGPVMYLGDAAGIAAILDAATVPPDTDMVEGRYVIPFTNMYGNNTYRYMLLSVEVSGTIASGINFISYATKLY